MRDVGASSVCQLFRASSYNICQPLPYTMPQVEIPYDLDRFLVSSGLSSVPQTLGPDATTESDRCELTTLTLDKNYGHADWISVLQESYSIRFEAQLSLGGRSAGVVLKAQLVAQHDPSIRHDVVCKIGWTADHLKRLANDATAYSELTELQGNFIPQLLGVFEGTTNKGPTTCLITSYAGSPCREALINLPKDQRSVRSQCSSPCFVYSKAPFK